MKGNQRKEKRIQTRKRNGGIINVEIAVNKVKKISSIAINICKQVFDYAYITSMHTYILYLRKCLISHLRNFSNELTKF